MISNKIEFIVSILEKVSNGTLDPNQALEQWPNIDEEDDDLIAGSWHDLSHFANDSDIRDKDKEYDSYQRKLLKTRASEIIEKYS